VPHKVANIKSEQAICPPRRYKVEGKRRVSAGRVLNQKAIMRVVEMEAGMGVKYVTGPPEGGRWTLMGNSVNKDQES
jgi:hypothetical protein